MNFPSAALTPPPPPPSAVHFAGLNPYQWRVPENRRGQNWARSDYWLVLLMHARKIDLASPSFDIAEHLLLLTGVHASAANKWRMKRVPCAARSSPKLPKSKKGPCALLHLNDLGMCAWKKQCWMFSSFNVGRVPLQVAAMRRGRGKTSICAVPAADLYGSFYFLRALRHGAYYLFALMTWKEQAKNRRRILPSCVLAAIRKKFPSADGTYTGFKHFWNLVAVSIDTEVACPTSNCTSLFFNFQIWRQARFLLSRNVFCKTVLVCCFLLGTELCINESSIITTAGLFQCYLCPVYWFVHGKITKHCHNTICSFYLKISTRNSHLFKCR